MIMRMMKNNNNETVMVIGIDQGWKHENSHQMLSIRCSQI